MAAHRKDLADLRAQRLKAERLNRAKTRRMAKAHGVEPQHLTHSVPRQRTAAEINRMSKRSLEKELAESRHFRSRTVSADSFVQLGDNNLIPKPVWNRFDSVQRRRNRQIARANADVDSIPLSYFGGQTVGERKRMVSPDRAQRMETDLGYGVREIEPRHMASLAAMKRVQQRLEKMNRNGNERERARHTAMQSLDAVFSQINAPDLSKRIRNLTTDQFFAFWSIRDSSNDLFAWYEGDKMLDDDQISAEKASHIRARGGDFKRELEMMLDDIESAGGRL